jgi:ubiquinone biosynthesis protein COQ4
MTLVSSYRSEVSGTPAESFEAETFRIQPLKALKALFRLFKNKEDTAQVFEIMRALSGNSVPRGYARLLSTPQGGAIAYRRQELAEVLSDRQYLASLPEGSVGRAYLDFVTAENISAEGLIEESRKGNDKGIDSEHPYAWYGRRMRDVHDLWHILTGYSRDALGEACVVAFSYSQTKSLGFGLIAWGGIFKIRPALPGHPVYQAVRQAFRHGREAKWLPGEDYLKLLAEPLEAARARLNIQRPTFYEAIPKHVRDRVGSDMQFATA